MSREIITTQNAPAAIGPYSQAVKCGNYVFTSGQIPLNPATGQLISGDIREQTHRVMTNLQAVLQAAGTSLDKVVKTTLYIKDMNQFGEINEVYAGFFKESPPARSTVEVARLPKDVGIEIEAIATL